MHCRGARVIRAASSAVAIAVLSLAFSRASAGEATECWSRPVLGRTWLFRTQADGASAHLSLSFANPYCIAGLATLRCEADLAEPWFEAGGTWIRLSHPLYHEDRFVAAACIARPISHLFAGVQADIAVRGPAGFPRERSSSISLLAAYRRAGAASFQMAIPVRCAGSEPPADRLWSCAFFLGALGIGFDHFSPDGISSEYRFEARCALDRSVAFFSAFAFRSEELSAGLSVSMRRFMLAFSWSVHPALGLSAAIDVGKWWRW